MAEKKTSARKKTGASKKKASAAKKTAAATAAASGSAEKPVAKKASAKKTSAKKTAAKKTTAASKKKGAVAGSATATGGTPGMLRVTLVRSAHGRLRTHRACVMGLGLRRMHQTIKVADTPENRGMINKISYMLSVEEA